MDNASNNDTLLDALTSRIEAHGGIFHRENGHMRCFGHVLNLVAQGKFGSLWFEPSNNVCFPIPPSGT